MPGSGPQCRIPCCVWAYIGLYLLGRRVYSQQFCYWVPGSAGPGRPIGLGLLKIFTGEPAGVMCWEGGGQCRAL